MEIKHINPRIFIDHTSAIQASATIQQTQVYFGRVNTEFAAILNEDKVMGLISRETALANQISTQHARDCISAHALIFSIEDPTQNVIDRALTRPKNHLLDDMILVDESSHFLGLISNESFIKMQKSHHDKQIESLTSTLNAKDRQIDDLQNDLKLSERQLSENREMVKRIKEMRSDFISKFSYEAQTPITSIQTILDSLATSGLNARHQQLIDSANANTHTLLRLISSTLDYTRIETDRLYLTETVFSPLKAIKQCIEAAKEETIEKDLMLQLDYQGISPYVLGDERCFTLVIENLIDRALDQTSVGGIRITVSQHAMRRKTILHLEIRDSGSGWSLAESQNLFELQNKPATETQIPDLGTLISERIITKMGGRLQCTHEEDQGSLVTLDLPFKIPAESPKSEEPPKTEEPPKSEASKARQQTTADPQIQLLVVDDKRINLEIVTRHLATLNCKTHSASNGMEALKKLRTLQIDYIFMECRMSELSGFETTELIRAGECGKHNENIFITGMAAQLSDSVRKNGTAAGMNHFIAKPVNQDSIEVALSAWRDDQTKDAIPCRNSEAN